TQLDIWIDTDAGWDIDDIFAIELVARSNANIVGISTVNYYPQEKAKIVKTILNNRNRTDVPVFAGVGYDPETDNPQKLFELNPLWPRKIFGVPNPKDNEKPIYNLQGCAYRKKSTNFKNLIINGGQSEMIKAFKMAAENAHDKLVIVAIGPLLNIAEALKQHPEISSKLRIWLMGGWIENEGKVIRSGYNTGINPIASQIVFNSGSEIFLVNSQFIIDKGFEISEEEYEAIKQTKKGDKLSQMIWEDWMNWNGGDVFSRKHFADIVTAYLALNPDLVTNYERVQITYYPITENQRELEDLGFLYTKIPLITVRGDVEGQGISNLKLITGLGAGIGDAYQSIRLEILEHIRRVL
ncbi:inosine-uridine preferring nucleoside hydrolase-domain-containing protein, partial [Paraphysoderma sedebokerense]